MPSPADVTMPSSDRPVHDLSQSRQAPSNWDWWKTFGKSFVREFGAAQKDAWNKGYWSCLGDEVFGPFGALMNKGIEEAATGAIESNGRSIAGAYYHFTDGRFTAWGRVSRVLVPQAAAKIATVSRAVSVTGWAIAEVEGFRAIHKCAGELTR